jgi:arsenate reductase
MLIRRDREEVNDLFADRTAPGRRKTRVLFICRGNAGRSLLAQALLNESHGDCCEVYSAGTKPARKPSHLTIAVLEEIGIDVSDYHPRPLTEYLDDSFDIIVILTCEVEEIPYLPKADLVVRSPFPDPHAVRGSPDIRLMAYRSVRDMIEGWIETVLMPVIAEKS